MERGRSLDVGGLRLRQVWGGLEIGDGAVTRNDDHVATKHAPADLAHTQPLCLNKSDMSDLQRLSDVQVLLLAARFISDVNVDSLQILAAERKDVLTEDIIYRLLLTLYPADQTARSALLALLQTIRTDYHDVSSLDTKIDTSSVSGLSPASAITEAQHLRLRPFDSGIASRSKTSFAKFLISWTHHVETSGGSLQDTALLVQEFSQHDQDVAVWAQSYLLPIVRLQYDFYPEEQDHVSLRQLESVAASAGVAALLRYSKTGTIARDLDDVLDPWIAGNSDEHPTATWHDVFDWILSTGQTQFELSAHALLEWAGPSGDRVLQDMAQAAFALIYADRESGIGPLAMMKNLFHRAVSLAGVSSPDLSTNQPTLQLGSLATSGVPDLYLQLHSLLRQDNELTRITSAATNFLAGVLSTAEILQTYKIDISIPNIAKICLSKSKHRQQQQLLAVLQQIPRLTTAELKWAQVRTRLQWLQSWHAASAQTTVASISNSVAFLGAIDQDTVDEYLLDAILASDQYPDARSIYLNADQRPLPEAVVEQHIVAAIHRAYDNASNGNRSRGGMKRASDLLATFKPLFPASAELQGIEYLLKATHGLSFYQLTLQHGVPFRPVNIRAQKDPLSLIQRVLQQDVMTYAKLDDLIEVGRNLVMSRPAAKAGVADRDQELIVLEAEQRVTFLAISSALANHDFDTAYSYITTRLLPTRQTQFPPGFIDDTSWRAAYAAGRYRPHTSPSALHAQISNLSKRMELLSLALTLAPNAEPLCEILGTWRRCEVELDNLKSSALEEERSFEASGNDVLPGGFGMDDRERDVAETRKAMARRNLTGGTASYEEEAPMGLFDMARGAASALRKNAFPLNAAGGRDLKIQQGKKRDSAEMNRDHASSPDGERVRKRDMVGNMVTSGLVSGMGWVLGAQPVDRSGQQQQRH